MLNPEISILIITHNQRLLLERCLDSVLNQRIEVPYEIIISDDGVDDGTKAFVQQLSCSERIRGKKNLIELKYVYCFNEKPWGRIGWNRLSAYKHARGKYFVNVDADDFLIGTDLYQKEYEMLESHPECSMVQTRLLILDDGDSIEKIKKGYPFSEKLENGAIFSLEDVLRFGLRGQHQTYMYCRRPQDDMERTLGCSFDDIYITYYHLQFGSVVFLDKTGYVWVQYQNSDSHSMNRDEHRICYGLLPLTLAVYCANNRNLFMAQGINYMWRMVFRTQLYPELRKNVKEGWTLSTLFIFRFYAEDLHGISSWSRYWLIFFLLLLMKCCRLKSKFWLDILYRSMV